MMNRLYSVLEFLSRPNSNRLHPAEIPCTPLTDYYLGDAPDNEAIANVQLVISDWGVATWADPERRATNDVVPLLLRSPELLLGAPWDEKVDIWALGCVIYDLAENNILFDGEGPIGDNGWGYNSEWHLLDMVEILGDFPQALLESGDPEIVGYVFNGDGQIIARRERPRPQLPEWIDSFSGVGAEDFLEFLDAMLTLDPAERLSAETLLNAPWLESSDQQNEPATEVDDTYEEQSLAEDNLDEEADGPRITPGITVTAPDGHKADIAKPDAQAPPTLERTEKHVIIAPDGTGCVAEPTADDSPEGHVQKKVKLSSAGIAVPHDHEFMDHPMDEANGIPNLAEAGTDQLMDGASENQSHHVPVGRTAESLDKEQTVEEKEAEEGNFLGNENGQKVIKHPLNRGVAFFGTATPIELLLGGFWLVKEVLGTFFRLLG